MKADLPDDDSEAPPPRRWSWRWIVVASSLAGVVVLVVLVVFVPDIRAEFWTKGAARPGGLAAALRKPPALLGAATLAPDDPALRFSETGVGQIVFSTASDICRRHLFDNRTGRTTWAVDLPCANKAEVIEDDPPHRLNGMQKAFQQ